MLLSELAEKELIQIKDGVRCGLLAETECLLNAKTGQIYGFELVQKGYRLPFQAKENKVQSFIPWTEISLIGEDRILFKKTQPLSSGYIK
ncbi:YlmC/YmxH family sporulation protein [Rummeliibacillus sp. NPDC094406]|uniref:YlmC/YmxH family sporulation protein n=1 Tax=Rummeliibacillus sp. NPDC094406 TaxID=3364511 RepID=UPI00382FD40D